jgi:uncharacterized membrane protein/protein-disulfide isomerase
MAHREDFMDHSLTLGKHPWRRFWSVIAGAGMIAASAMTIRHFFMANFPESIYKGSFCDISAFFNCDSSAFSNIAHYQGIPMGWLGIVVGALVLLGAIFPSAAFERTNKSLALLNVLGVLGLLIYSVFFLKKLCLLCTGFYVFSILSVFLFWKFGLKSEKKGLSGLLGTYVSPSIPIGLAAAIVLGAGGYGFHEFYRAKQDAQKGGIAMKVVQEYYTLARVPDPSFISPYMVAQASERWEDAPVRIVEFADYRCPDCLFMHQLLTQLKKDFPGQLNIAFQFFPLEGKCNQIVEKDIHPGACDLAAIAAYDPAKFPAINEELWAGFQESGSPEWRLDLARRHGVEAALTDGKTSEIVSRIIATGAEYEKTSTKYSHGIRSTPTIILNNRMIIGTIPYPQLKAIVESILQGDANGGAGEKKFFENWVDLRSASKAKKK